MKTAYKISKLGLKKYLQDESQQSLIKACTKITKYSVKISPISVETSGKCALYQLQSNNTKINAQDT